MFALAFFIPVLIVAIVWGYILLNIAGNNRRFLRDNPGNRDALFS